MQGCNLSAALEPGLVGHGKHGRPPSYKSRFTDSEKVDSKMNNLQDQLGNLSAAEKFDLLDALWESLQADELSLTAVQREELNHRLVEYQRNPDDVIPWAQVRAGLSKKQ